MGAEEEEEEGDDEEDELGFCERSMILHMSPTTRFAPL